MSSKNHSKSTRNTLKSTRKTGVLGQGITGADLLAPLFDGKGAQSEAFLIDIETPSMEREPDVRAYFWMVGQFCSEGPIMPTLPAEPKERMDYDQDMVRKGREILKSARKEGHGLFLSSSRKYMAFNTPGDLWHRIPVMGVVKGFLDRELQPSEDEGGFNLDPDRINGAEEVNLTARGDLILTNIRSPLWYAPILHAGIVPGTLGWDKAIWTLYHSEGHPASCIWSNIGGRAGIVYSFMCLEESLAEHRKVAEVVQRDWYRKEDYSGEGVLQASEQAPDSSSNHLVFDPTFLSEIEPPRSTSRSRRFK